MAVQCSPRWILPAAVLAVLMMARAAAAQVEAVAGSPYGVAQVTVRFSSGDAGLAIGMSSFTVDGPQGRVFYPAFRAGLLKRLFGSDAPAPRSVPVLFLFQGDAPFEVAIGTPTRTTVSVVPRHRTAAAHGRLLKRWWLYYNAQFRQLRRDGDYPPIVETYLASTLARRLDFEEPFIDRWKRDQEREEGSETLALLLGVEAKRMEILRASALGVGGTGAEATLPLPDEIRWRRATLPRIEDEVVIEPMAMRVPEECFYVRFGQYPNFLWVNALLGDYGNDIGSMVAARGYRTEISRRVQDQLVMEQGILAEILGPQAIADVAMIGMDTFSREGMAVGAIFEARGSLLGVDLARQRHAGLFREKDRGATMKDIQIAGRDVSFLSTPDNRLRSYYAVDGNYHLVTNTRRIVERFFEVADGKRPLGANREFRYARSMVPTSREDTIFVYFSSAFFRGLMSPHCQIELNRRLRAATDIELVSLASLMARREGRSDTTIPQFIDAGLLPRTFGLRPDGSTPVMTDDGTIDSLRGARGFFTPVPDIAIERVSRAEREQYAKQAAYTASRWQQMDPLVLAVKRFPLEQKGHERITIDALISPLHDSKYGWLMSSLGEPTKSQLVPAGDEIVSVEAALGGGIIFPGVPPHTLFLRVLDHAPLAESRPTEVLKLLQVLRTTPGYLGAWPKPGFLDLLPLNIEGTPDAQGISELPFGLLRWQGRGFSVLSMDRNILGAASSHLGFVDTDKAAQIRLHVGDLSKAKFGRWLNAIGYERARQVSVGNARFLSILTQQLGVPRTDALHVAQNLLDARLVCTLGGNYHVVDHQGAPVWQSTAWPPAGHYELPRDYTATLLTWFRGMEARLLKYPNGLLVRGHLDMQRKPRKGIIQSQLSTWLKGSNSTSSARRRGNGWKPRTHKGVRTLLKGS